MRLDDQDRRALQALDLDFEISADGETATCVGETEIVIVRPDADGNHLLLTITFPNGRDFLIRLGRRQTLEELDVEGGEGA